MSSRCPEPGAWLAACALCLLLVACERTPEPQSGPGPVQDTTGKVQMPSIQPGAPSPAPKVSNPFAGNAQAIIEGERLYNQFGCAGCHAGGGGGMGPPLIDAKWIYGSAPANIFASIIEGRPQGMPSFRDRVTPEDAWRLVTYLRALGGIESELPKGVRADALQPYATENLKDAPAELRKYLQEALGER